MQIKGDDLGGLQSCYESSSAKKSIILPFLAPASTRINSCCCKMIACLGHLVDIQIKLTRTSPKQFDDDSSEKFSQGRNLFLQTLIFKSAL